MDLTDILASLFGGGQSAPAFGGVTQVGDHNDPNAFQASLARFAPPSSVNTAARQAMGVVAMPPVAPTQNPQQQSQNPGLVASSSPQGQPDPQASQASPAGGGFGGMLTDLFMPQTAAKNRTAAYLQQQGMDAGTANLIVSDPGMLRAYLQKKMSGADTSDFDQRAAAAKQYGLDTTTPEGREYVLTGKLPNAIQGNDDTAKQIAGAIISGDQPPDMRGLYKYSAPIRAELARQHYDLTTANEDWQATNKFLASANGPQQLRMRQAIDALPPQLDLIDSLSAEWSAGGFKPLNAAAMTLALNGGLGAKENSIATRLQAAINDVSSEIGQVYMGGNSPTDHALDLAKSNLNANWSEQTLKDMTKQIRQTIAYRQNSLRNAGVVGMPAGTNPYDQTQGGGSLPAAPPGNAPAGAPQAPGAPAQASASGASAVPQSYLDGGGTAAGWQHMPAEKRKLWQP